MNEHEDFIEYELGIDPSFINHADEAFLTIESLCDGDDKEFIKSIREFLCYGAEDMESPFSEPGFNHNLNRILASVSSCSKRIDPELISFIKSGVENFANIYQFLTPEIQESLIEALDKFSKTGSAINDVEWIISTIKSFIDEKAILAYGTGGTIAAFLMISYIKSSLEGKSDFKELIKELNGLESIIQSSHITTALNLRMAAVIAAQAPRTKNLSQQECDDIEEGRKNAIKILRITKPYANDFIKHLKISHHHLNIHIENQMKALTDIEKLNVSGNSANAGMLLSLMYSGRLKEFRVKPTKINYNTILHNVKCKKILSQKCDNLQDKMKTNMHNLYWAVLRNVSTPKDLISLLMKNAYLQREGIIRDFKTPKGIESADIKKSYADFNAKFKKDYHEFLKIRWKDDLVLNKIYGEVLFLRSFLAFNLDMSYKLADYSFSYAARQAYLGVEDVGRPLLHPISTVQNLFFLGQNLICHPIETPTKIVKGLGTSTWNQPTRAVTKLAGDILLSGGAETLVSSTGLKLTSASAPSSIAQNVNYVGTRSMTVTQKLAKGTTAGSSNIINMTRASVGLGTHSAAVFGARAGTITPMFTRLTTIIRSTLPPLDSSSINSVKEALKIHKKYSKKT